MATTATRPARSTGPASNHLSRVVSKGRNLPSRVILHGVEGVGKTSTAAANKLPIFGMTKGETGLETLIDQGLVGDVPHFPEWQDWNEACDSVSELIHNDHEYKTLVIDTLNGLERMCHEHVCQRDFAGEWGKNGFTSYMQGYDVSLADWRKLLNLLDELREKKQTAIFCLCHTKVKTFKNPEGADFDRYQPDMHDKTWSLTHKWADIVLFANFDTFVKDEEKLKSKEKGKAYGGETRSLHVTRTAAFDAKNRHGLTKAIDMGCSGRAAMDNFVEAVKTARKAVK